MEKAKVLKIEISKSYLKTVLNMCYKKQKKKSPKI